MLVLVLEKLDSTVTLSEPAAAGGKIGSRCGGKAQQVEHEHDDEHEHESPNFGNSVYWRWEIN